jgi:hypothetical protein
MKEQVIAVVPAGRIRKDSVRARTNLCESLR